MLIWQCHNSCYLVVFVVCRLFWARIRGSRTWAQIVVLRFLGLKMKFNCFPAFVELSKNHRFVADHQVVLILCHRVSSSIHFRHRSFDVVVMFSKSFFFIATSFHLNLCQHFDWKGFLFHPVDDCDRQSKRVANLI